MKFTHAIIISFVVHLVLIGLLVFNFSFSKVEHKQSMSNNPKPKIMARAVNTKNVDSLVKKLKQQQVNDKRKQQQRLNELKKAEQEAKRKRKREEEKAANALKKRKQAEKQRIKEEKRAAALKKKRLKEEQERKKKAEAEKQRKIEAEHKRKQAEKQRKLEEERKRKEKKRKEKERKRKEAAEKARQEALQREMELQMQAETAALADAHQQQVMTEVDKFVALIRGKIERNWIEPEGEGYCVFKIKLSPGGLVLDVTATSGDTQHCTSGERAISKSEPLPVSKDPDVFELLKSINLTLDNRQEIQE